MRALRTGRFSDAIAAGAAAVMLLAAVALTGCGGITTNPGGPSGTGTTAAAQSLVVPDSVRAQVLGIMKSSGMVVANPAYVFVNYDSPDKTLIVVTGSFRGPKDLKAGAPLVYYTKALLENVNGKWTITKAE